MVYSKHAIVVGARLDASSQINTSIVVYCRMQNKKIFGCSTLYPVCMLVSMDNLNLSFSSDLSTLLTYVLIIIQ